jgi:hypothetical protein
VTRESWRQVRQLVGVPAEHGEEPGRIGRSKSVPSSYAKFPLICRHGTPHLEKNGKALGIQMAKVFWDDHSCQSLAHTILLGDECEHLYELELIV